MKKIAFILSLVSLSLTVASASTSAQNSNDNAALQLPAFRVEASRYTSAEQSIEDSLSQLRADAAKPQKLTLDASLNASPEVANKSENKQQGRESSNIAAKPMPLRPVGRS